MKFQEDIIVDFVKSQKRMVVEKSSYLSGVGETIVTIKTSNGESWCFVGGMEVLVRGIGVRGELNQRPATSKVMTRRWREFAVDRVSGFQRDSMLGQFIKDARAEFLSEVEDLSESETLCHKVDTLGNEELKHLLKLEEKKFELGLKACKSEWDFSTVRSGVMVNRAYYGRNLNNVIQYLLDYVERDIISGGEKVYKFTPVQLQHYERLKEIAEKIDMVMKYQIYRADQAEMKREESEQ